MQLILNSVVFALSFSRSPTYFKIKLKQSGFFLNLAANQSLMFKKGDREKVIIRSNEQ
ncbi:hypothetical protein [Argonema antarcticum]|uniref:hypothetical protein n=1 Tax=Argonema antarcticum TaxID=2942763 RepID=UPI002012CF11|nr:hypothetical protein [Argonema antarcticum]MCL1473621.1 hypothetical protein [Argonema antarcticum A004/B2]